MKNKYLKKINYPIIKFNKKIFKNIKMFKFLYKASFKSFYFIIID